MSEVRHVPAQPAKVIVQVEMTPEEYEQISTNAAWGGGGSVASYMVKCALGHRSRGC